MRQDYLSTSYLDKKYLPSERSKMREIWIDPSYVCWDNPVRKSCIFLIPFTILQMKSDKNVVKSFNFSSLQPCHTWQIINKWAELVVSREHFQLLVVWLFKAKRDYLYAQNSTS